MNDLIIRSIINSIIRHFVILRIRRFFKPFLFGSPSPPLHAHSIIRTPSPVVATRDRPPSTSHPSFAERGGSGGVRDLRSSGRRPQRPRGGRRAVRRRRHLGVVVGGRGDGSAVVVGRRGHGRVGLGRRGGASGGWSSVAREGWGTASVDEPRGMIFGAKKLTQTLKKPVRTAFVSPKIGNMNWAELIRVFFFSGSPPKLFHASYHQQKRCMK